MALDRKMIYKLLTAFLGVLLAGVLAFLFLGGPDSSGSATMWYFSALATSPDGRHIAGWLVESDRHDTRSTLGIAELGDGQYAQWRLVYPFDSVTWTSLDWTDSRHLLVHGKNLAGDQIAATTRVRGMDVEVTLKE